MISGENEGIVDFFKDDKNLDKVGIEGGESFSVNNDSSAADLNIMKLKMIKNLRINSSDNCDTSDTHIDNNSHNYDNNDSEINQNLKIISDQISSSQALSCSTLHSILVNKLDALQHSMDKHCIPPL
jgi:hypothetical protein